MCVDSPVICIPTNACFISDCSLADGLCKEEAFPCDDLNECTVDSCDPMGDPMDPCINTPDTGAPCDTGDLCLIGTCTETGSCQSEPVVCEPDEECINGVCETTCTVIDFEDFTANNQGERFGIDPPLPRYYEGFDWAYNDTEPPAKICTVANPTTCWGSWAVNDLNGEVGNVGGHSGDNWIKARTANRGKGAKITYVELNPAEPTGFIFKSMWLMTRDTDAFLDEVTVTWRDLSDADVSVVVDLDAHGFDMWFEVTAADLGISASTPLKSMWFTAPGITNANAGKFGLDDFTVQ